MSKSVVARRSYASPMGRPRSSARWLLLPLVVSAAAGSLDGTARAGGAQTIRVRLTEYAIVMPAKLRPGRTTFVLENGGRFPHNFTAIYGPVLFHSPDVQPGRTARLTVTLVPGAYMVACTILNGGHLAQGMFALFTIGARSHGSGTWHYP